MKDNIELEIDKIYKKLLPSIKKIYVTYNYIGLNEEEYEQLIKEIILKIYIKNLETKIDNNLYIRKIKENIEKHIKFILENPENVKIIINNFTSNNLIIHKTIQENIKELRKLSRFIKKYDIIITPDTYIEIINSNAKLSSILKEIIDKNINLIEKKGIELLDDDQNVITILDIYCMINNIRYKIYENIPFNINIEENIDNLIKDSLKMYLSEINLSVLTQEEELELAKRKSEGDIEARNKLIEHNLKWVVNVAKRYIGRGLELQELIQEGNAGLIIGIDKFDYTKGYRISTYTYHWIRQSITRAIIEKTRMIRLPIHIDEKIKKYQQVTNKLEQRLNRTPTKEELARELNIKIEELNKIYIYMNDITSLNAIIDEKDNSELETFIESNEDNAEEIYVKKDLTSEIKILLKKCCLDDREIETLLLRNGFYGEKLTLSKVGEILGGLTRERIRQIESKALQKIRTSAYINNLLEYAENPDEALKNLQMFKSFYENNKKTTKAIKKQENLEEVKETTKLNEQTKEHHPTKSIFTIFDKFTELGYTKEEILSILPLLPTQDKKRVMLRNGPDLDNPVVSDLIRERDRNLYITHTLPKIEKLLLETYGKKQYQRIRKK